MEVGAILIFPLGFFFSVLLPLLLLSSSSYFYCLIFLPKDNLDVSMYTIQTLLRAFGTVKKTHSILSMLYLYVWH